MRERTGLPIHRVEIDRIDYLRDSARIYVFYFEKDWRNSGSAYQAGDNDD